MDAVESGGFHEVDLGANAAKMFHNTTQGLVFNRSHQMGNFNQLSGSQKVVQKEDRVMDLFARMDAIQADSDDDDEILRDLDLDNFDIDENRGSGKQ